MPTIKQEYFDKLNKHLTYIQDMANQGAIDWSEKERDGLREWLFCVRHNAISILELIQDIQQESKSDLPTGLESNHKTVEDGWYYLWYAWYSERVYIEKEPDEDGYYKLIFPFTDSLGYDIWIFIKPDEHGEYCLTDKGRTLYFVAKSKTVRDGFAAVLEKVVEAREMAIRIKTREIFTTATKEELPSKITQMISCILTVDSWQVVFKDIDENSCDIP